MGIFSGLFKPSAPQAPQFINIDMQLGNVAVIGNSKPGKEALLTNYAIDAYNGDAAIFLFRNAAMGMTTYPQISPSMNMVCEMDNSDNAMTEQFDAFAHCGTEADKNSAVIRLFEAYSPIDAGKKMNYQSYIDVIRRLFKAAGKQVRLNEYFNHSIEEIDDLNRRAPISQTEKDRNERFLNGFRADAMGIKSYFRAFSENTIGYIMSGTKNLEKIFQTKDFMEVSFDFSSKQSESEILLSIFIDNIKKYNFTMSRKKRVIVIADEIPNESLINSGFLRLLKMTNCQAIFTVSDIANLIEKSNDWIEAADSYFFLRQNSNKNKEYCAEFFGKYEKQKISEMTGQTNQKPSIFNLGFIDPEKTTVTKNKTISYEKEYVYPPEEFAKLGDFDAIYFFKTNNIHGLLNLK
jgi:hypothetical protein